MVNVNDKIEEIKLRLTSKEIKEVEELVEGLNSIKTYSDYEEEMKTVETEEEKKEIMDKASKEFNPKILEKAIYFSNDQVLLFKEKYAYHGLTTVKSDVVEDKLFIHKFKRIKNIKDHLEFYKKRNSNNIKNDDFNKTVVRFISVNIVNDKYVIEILPANFLESLIISYTKYHMFKDDKDENIKKEIRNILRNSKLKVDENIYFNILDDFKKLISKQ